MSRDPVDVIKSILSHIPAERVRLYESLEKIQRDSLYLPPEHPFSAWYKLVDTLESELHNPPEYGWEKVILSIMKGSAL